MTEALKLTIITINRNNCEGLRRTLDSVVNQTFQDFEYIVIDGASSDGSAELIKEYPRIDFWVSEPDTGIYNAMNKGIAKANGEYLLFLNSGDELIENGPLQSITQNSNADILYFPCIMKYVNGLSAVKNFPKELRAYFFFRDSINHQSALIKKQLFAEFGLYNESYKILSDFEFWIKSIVIGNCKCQYIDSPISKYDMTGITSVWNSQLDEERTLILKSLLPRSIYDDLLSLSKFGYMIDLIIKFPFFNSASFFLYRIFIARSHH